MEKRREKLSGLLLKGLYMDFNHQKPQTFSMKRAVTESYLKLLNKPRGELKLQGTHLRQSQSCRVSQVTVVLCSVSWVLIFDLQLAKLSYF